MFGVVWSAPKFSQKPTCYSIFLSLFESTYCKNWDLVRWGRGGGGTGDARDDDNKVFCNVDAWHLSFFPSLNTNNTQKNAHSTQLHYIHLNVHTLPTTRHDTHGREKLHNRVRHNSRITRPGDVSYLGINALTFTQESACVS